MTTNVSSGLTKYKLLLTDTGQANNATGGLVKGAGWDMRGTDCGRARTWGELTWGKWYGLRHEGQMGHTETWGEQTGAKWDWLRYEGNWLGPKKNGAQCPKPLYLSQLSAVSLTSSPSLCRMSAAWPGSLLKASLPMVQKGKTLSALVDSGSSESCISSSVSIKLNTSIAACLESCKGAERRPTIYSWLVYDILVLHFKRQPLRAGWYVFLYKVRAFRTCL